MHTVPRNVETIGSPRQTKEHERATELTHPYVSDVRRSQLAQVACHFRLTGPDETFCRDRCAAVLL